MAFIALKYMTGFDDDGLGVRDVGELLPPEDDFTKWGMYVRTGHAKEVPDDSDEAKEAEKLLKSRLSADKKGTKAAEEPEEEAEAAEDEKPKATRKKSTAKKSTAKRATTRTRKTSTTKS